jgi:hypothetical protein
MRFNFFPALLIVILLTGTVVLAAPVVVRWGGPGYDPAAKGKNYSSLFSAHPDLTAGAGMAHFEIWVDSEKTANGVGRMVIRQQGREDLVSTYCHKAQLHITAPYSCRFKKADFLGRAGIGELTVYSPEGQDLLRIFADISRIKQVF